MKRLGESVAVSFVKHWIATLLALAALCSCGLADEKGDAVRTLIPWLLDESQSLRGIAFADVIAATSGKRVLPFDRDDADDQRILAAIGAALESVLAEMNAPSNKVQNARRVNEMSSHFEDSLRAKLDATAGLSCDFPRTAAGKHQRSGYPDLRLVDKATGRVVYIDPKLFAKSSRGSSLRTFYFEPKRETNKVTDDARHVIAGIAHERGADGRVRFVSWELVDLSGFRVRLKAEFEGSNADMYRDAAVLKKGAAAE